MVENLLGFFIKLSTFVTNLFSVNMFVSSFTLKKRKKEKKKKLKALSFID